MNRWHFVLGLIIVALFVTLVAPLVLVGSLVNRWTPSPIIGYAIALGLSLAVVINSILTKWKVSDTGNAQADTRHAKRRMRPRLAVRVFGKRSFSELALYILASSEVVVSASEMMQTASERSELGIVTLVGIIGVALILEFTLLSSGNALREVLNRISAETLRATKRHAKTERPDRVTRPSDTRSVATGSRDATSSLDATPEKMASLPRPLRVSHAERLDEIRRANSRRNGDGPMTAAEIVAEFGVGLRQAQRDAKAVRRVP